MTVYGPRAYFGPLEPENTAQRPAQGAAMIAWTGDLEAAPPGSRFANWVSRDRRWTIVHQAHSESGLWELHGSDGARYGGWTRLRDAKDRAQALANGEPAGWWCALCQARHPGNRLMQGCPEWQRRFNALAEAAAAFHDQDRPLLEGAP